nr:anthranilate phosphoribosyltransferase [Acidobacteriota bacterium]
MSTPHADSTGTFDSARRAMQRMLSGTSTNDEVRAFLLAYNERHATPDELAGFLDAVRNAATPIELPSDIAERSIDIVGTGGDKSGSVNVSTMAALVVAGVGVPVCKHGNRSASSKCGTADVLEALGARIEQTATQVSRTVTKVGFGFVFAPAFHPAFRHVGPIRRELGVPTIFNVIGPMANPANVAHMLVGVADPQRLSTMSKVLATRTRSSWVVHGHGGLDELSLAGPNRVVAFRRGFPEEEMIVDAGAVGLAPAPNETLVGGDASHNARVVRGVVTGEVRGAIRDVVVLNAAAALVVAGAARDLENGVLLATASIDSGTARATLDAYIAETTLNT